MVFEMCTLKRKVRQVFCKIELNFNHKKKETGTAAHSDKKSAVQQLCVNFLLSRSDPITTKASITTYILLILRPNLIVKLCKSHNKVQCCIRTRLRKFFRALRRVRDSPCFFKTVTERTRPRDPSYRKRAAFSWARANNQSLFTASKTGGQSHNKR